MSDFRYEIKTSLPVIWLENIDKKNPSWVRTQRTHTVTKLILVDLVDDEEVVELLQRLTMRDLKKRKELLTLIRSIDHHFTLHWLWQIFLMWSQINVLSSIRLTGSRQIDLKFQAFECQENIFRKLKF